MYRNTGRINAKRDWTDKKEETTMSHSFNDIRRRLRRLPAGEEGVTGLETAIILIAFVIVASVFGYVVLTTGVFATEKGKDATIAGLNQVRTTLMQRGGATAIKSATGNTVDTITVRVSTMPDGAPINASDLSVRYQDANQSADTGFGVTQVKGDGDSVIETRELFDITIDLTNLAVPLGAGEHFIIMIQPVNGSTLYLERTTPYSLEAYTYLG